LGGAGGGYQKSRAFGTQKAKKTDYFLQIERKTVFLQHED
jgi:hypothetical protein